MLSFPITRAEATFPVSALAMTRFEPAPSQA